MIAVILPFTVIYEDFVPRYEETALGIMDWLNISYPENLVFGPRHLLKQADSVSENWIQKYRATKENKENAMERISLFLFLLGILILLMFLNKQDCIADSQTPQYNLMCIDI